MFLDLTLYLLMSSADIFCKQFGTRLGSTKHRAWSGSKLFDSLMVFLFFCFFLKKISRQLKNLKYFPGSKKLRGRIKLTISCDLQRNTYLLFYVITKCILWKISISIEFSFFHGMKYIWYLPQKSNFTFYFKRKKTLTCFLVVSRSIQPFQCVSWV